MSPGHCRPDSVDLVVTSPPYGNANDYHLYHRFRLLWLGSDPRDLAKVEIGSHLRHQKESSGFGSYLDDMRASLTGMFAALRAGRYAVLVVGDAVYKSVQYSGAESMGRVAEELGFETVCIVERPIHRTRRSFVSAGRRATTEKLLVLRKAPRRVTVWFQPPPYKLWPYEVVLRGQETHAILGVDGVGNWRQPQSLEVDPYTLAGARRLAFTHGIGLSFLDTDATWQAVLENGGATQPSARKDPKYVTHGLHPYKGKFYPQLAKGLINLCSPAAGARILDPFCGSGTTLLEGYLNGCQTYGCDMNPLAAKIAKAKVGILDVDPDIVREALAILVRRIEDAPATLPHETEQFALPCQREIGSWFPAPVIVKLNWLLRSIRSISQGVTRDFLEVVVSSIVRDVSQQEPSDLRIRRRKEPIEDADVFGLYLDALDAQYERIERFWSVRGHAPNKFLPCRVIEGDSRSPATLTGLGVAEGTIDLILTSPPYATALPYIDTDRLSLLAILGLDSSARRPLEHGLIGSREIVTHERKTLEDSLESDRERIPRAVRDYLLDLHRRVAQADVGFRRQNMPALLLRFFRDMDAVLANCRRALRVGGYAMVVIGDNRIGLGDADERIPTTDLVQEIGVSNGFTLLDRIDISVTTENLLHIRNAITENVVLRMRRAS
jgi:DNA modification methylase